MTLDEIRSRYLKFFEGKGHTVIPSSPLVPENDPTTLFTSSGMQPLVPYLLGKNHPAGIRLADSQKCFRAVDIEEVGDNRHTTFFEMLGNWSLGDYFKEEQLQWLFEFLTKEIELPVERIWVTCFDGEPALGLPRDTESKEIWQKLGIPEEHIRFYDTKKNWWSRAGIPENMPQGEPGGPDSEVFYEFTHIEHDPKFGEACHPNCDCGRFLEIGNSVFMEYVKNADGTFGKLPKRNVDFGGGLERLAMVSENNNDIFAVNHRGILSQLEGLSGKKYEGEHTRAFRVVADHIKAAVFLIADGTNPSNTERGYVVRRLLRRAVRFADTLGVPAGNFADISKSVVEEYAQAYSNLQEGEKHIHMQIASEETKFRETLTKGLKEFEKLGADNKISGEEAFILFSTYGFPLEITLDLAQEKNIEVDVKGFEEEMEKHRQGSRAGSEQKFKGGLADTAEKTVRLHTAHHLLLRALQIVLGPEVKQRGSNITQERLRIDFSYPEKVTQEQLGEIELIVNEKIDEDLPVIRSEMNRDDAEKLGAEHEFGQKYPDRVSVYSVGPKSATQDDPKFAERFSIEFCGGPHVDHTGQLLESGHFKIQKEEAVSAGVRRIKAVLE